MARVELQGEGGLVLVGDAWGDEKAKPIVFLHGGGQTRHSWGAVAQRLGESGWRAITLDQRGHGESGWSAEGEYAIDQFVGDLRAVADALGEPPVVVGASLGGITGLLAEGEGSHNPLAALVLVDIATRVNREGTRRIDEFMRGNPDGFASLDEAADAIASYLPHRKRRKSNSGLLKNLRQRANGRYYWHWDPKILSDGFREDANSAERLTAAARAVKIPTLLVRGSISDVLTEAGAQEFLELVPHAEFVDVADAGHMVAGDSNDIFANAVEDFLQRI
ncbi:MAG: alpha/beta hydrolase [Gammaproteobacteria bacterium]|nr:alpha/beta hydrolase [Gammaproteobacteria bacterium]